MHDLYRIEVKGETLDFIKSGEARTKASIEDKDIELVITNMDGVYRLEIYAGGECVETLDSEDIYLLLEHVSGVEF